MPSTCRRFRLKTPRAAPVCGAVEKLGLFAGQLTESAIESVEIEYVGEVGELNFAPLTSATVQAC